MAIHRTLHIPTQPNVDVAESDLDEEQAIEDLGLSAEEERRFVTHHAEEISEDRREDSKASVNRLRKTA
ncbi:hypothetical protein FTW19_05410 [Terriglobus albidus]|uniref:Uncharacterized protein n=1 Tax=Terriglobus albidus TaxID=1592106 RepID=A0A5B9EBU1_9BACT|nr:hypothetical protein [Terriglobus albidus]QEE27496.1 hypothetical protein FTW19_05410 [Terriglobus albidus]